MKEFSREWFMAQAAASSRVVDSLPEPIRRNMVLASASLPMTASTTASQERRSSPAPVQTDTRERSES